MKNIEIIPSLLSANFAFLADEIKKVESAGCGKLHLDVMDGHFVPNITIGPVVIESIRKITDLYLQTHLMIDNPLKYVKSFAEAGSDCIIVHLEACSCPEEVISEIKQMGLEAGISIRPKTSSEHIRDLIEIIDVILVMTVEPGFGGQKIIENIDQKIIDVNNIAKDAKVAVPIAVDGGINLETTELVAAAGATQLIAGNAVFKGDIVKNIEMLKGAISQYA